MSTKKYVSLSKLSTFLDNLGDKFAELTHKHTLSDITDYVVDSELSPTSVNPVQNKAINAEFDAISDAFGALESVVDNKSNIGHTHTVSEITDLDPTDLIVSDDDNGNVIFTSASFTNFDLSQRVQTIENTLSQNNVLAITE